MLDFRIETFLTLCDTMNYTKTAKKLNMTQPAVTQQIHFLEESYQCKLFYYTGKTLYKTEKGELLEQYAKSMRHNEKNIRDRMKLQEDANKVLYIGATKTIGEYLIGEKIVKYLSNPKSNVSLVVDNTRRLLEQLEAGKLDFAFLEGYFDKTKYQYKLLREEPFVGICAKHHPFANREVSLEALWDENLILREEGSGTRDILDKMLQQYNFTVDNFHKTICINNFPVIKQLVEANRGISFVYQAVCREGDSIATFHLKNNPISHEFNCVFLKDTIESNVYRAFCS